ncbi:MIP/aquaporin family protein [Streptomyces sp. NPDC086835]|uniref:MIP/aquaporin family protein n=1 Tax=Streptomyces sp. NPDC086835 TaxID=3365761 RepID=UPI0037F939A3
MTTDHLKIVPSRSRGVPGPVAVWTSELFATAVLMLSMGLLFRWLFLPGAGLHSVFPGPAQRLAVDAVVSGLVVALLIASPLGRISGAHMNPAVTVLMWAMRKVPGRCVLPYVSAQLVGSVFGLLVARELAGTAVAHPEVAYALLRPSATSSAFLVTLGEASATFVLLFVVAALSTGPGPVKWMPWAVGAALAVLIGVTAQTTGGSLNPTRQFGPALMAGELPILWPYFVGPAAAALLLGLLIRMRGTE